MILAFNRRMKQCQKNYSATDKELLALVKGIGHYRHYMLGHKFNLKTDHRALTYLMQKKNLEGRLLRWALKLAEYDFKIEYIKGENNIADGFSRYFPKQVVNLAEEKSLSEENRETISREYHEISGHGSPNTMKFMISQKYKWKTMYREINEFCGKCLICLKSGNKKVNSNHKVVLSEHPNQLWEIDLMGRTNDSDGPKYVFVAIDHYSKWIETKILTEKTSKEICKAIEELIIKKYGIQNRILSDYGLEFDNYEVQFLKRKYNFVWEFASPYHHQTTGAVERVIQTLRSKLWKLSNFGNSSWGKSILAVNISFNRAIGTSPYIFRNGEQPELDIDKKLQRRGRRYGREELIRRRDINFEKYKKSIQKGSIKI